MDPFVNPVSQAWQSFWLAVGGGLIYLVLDLLVLRHNASFCRGALWFRIGVGLLVLGVGLGGLAWLQYAKGGAGAMRTALYLSYGVRAIGFVGLVVALVSMLRKSDRDSS